MEEKRKTNHDPDVSRTRSLLIWSQTRYHCATESSATRCSLINVLIHIHLT